MLEGAFSFRGRIGRLNYFLASLVMMPVIGVAIVVLAILMAASTRGAASVAFFVLLFGLLGIAVLWYSFSLQARRFRDIGWDPTTMIVGWIMIDIADMVLAHIVPSMAAGVTHTSTPIGMLINLGLSLSLMFWPGRAGDHISEVFDGAPIDAEPRPSRLDVIRSGGAGRFDVPAPALAGIPARAPLQAGVRKEFGRRGVR